jgi:type IV pilus assembly protein PilM
MLFSKKALGIEICNDGARIVLVTGKHDMPTLSAFSAMAFPADTLRFSLREENVLNPKAFVAVMRELHLKLPNHGRQVSLSLPDSTGRTMLLDMETRFKSRDEGSEIIRWKLKKTYPFDINEAHLDYQVIQEKETGEISLLVSLISRPVVRQYEDLLVEAGLDPNRIDFTTFNLYALFAQRLDLSENAMLVTCHDGVVGILMFYNGRLEFCRVKELSGGISEPNRIFREINSSFLIFTEKFPGHSPTEAFCVYSGEDGEAFSALVSEATGIAPVLLDAERVVVRDNSPVNDGKTLRRYAAALGAAARNLR